MYFSLHVVVSMMVLGWSFSHMDSGEQRRCYLLKRIGASILKEDWHRLGKYIYINNKITFMKKEKTNFVSFF